MRPSLSRNVGFIRQRVAELQAQGVAFINMYNYVPLGLKGVTFQYFFGTERAIKTLKRL